MDLCAGKIPSDVGFSSLLERLNDVDDEEEKSVPNEQNTSDEQDDDEDEDSDTDDDYQDNIDPILTVTGTKTS